MTTNTRSRNKFYWVLVIFIMPMVASWLMFYFHKSLPLKTMNHGELISPPLNAEFLTRNHKQLWRVVHIDNGRCDETCEHIHYQLNQVRKVLGKDQDRLVVMSLNGQSEEAHQFQSQYSRINPAKNVSNTIFLVDPLGNAFMQYPDDTKPMDILKDLKRVLEVSQIG